MASASTAITSSRTATSSSSTSRRGRPRTGEDGGIYCLVLHLARPQRIACGALGSRRLAAGWYVYTGSGKRNLAARLARHLRQDKAHRWHADYLCAAARIRQVWIWPWTVGAECRTNAWMQAQAGATVPWTGFGSSDCRCGSHLTAFRVRPQRHWGAGVSGPLLALDIDDR